MKPRLSDPSIGRSIRSYLFARFTDDSLFLPTTGRWLWNEPQKLQQHTLTFDVKALKLVVAKTAGLEGQSGRVEVKKLAEGASNKVMTATVGRRRFIVKVPDPVVPRRLITASEVATLEFLRAELNLPVPKVLAWSDNNDNTVGCEYMILEEAVGADLKNTWPRLSVKQRIGVVDQIITIQERLLEASKRFQGYGSLYFTEDAAKFKFRRQIEVSAANSSRFIIGPLAHGHFMESVLWESDFDPGPCMFLIYASAGLHAYSIEGYTPNDYLDSLARSSLLQISSRAHEETDVVPSRPFSFPIKPVSDLSNAAVRQMLELVRTITPHIVPRSPDHCLPLLWHRDLHDGNIFVSDEGKVTSIIDWQDANVLPLFLAIRKPQFLDLADDAQLFELPKGLKEMPLSVRSETWERFNKTMLQGYYLSHFRENIPPVAAVYDDKQINPIRRQIGNYARTSDGHDADALMLRNTLLRVQQNWSRLTGNDQIESAPSCPIHFNHDELEKHYEDARRLNGFRDILEASDISATFPLEGWVPVDLFNGCKNSLRKVIREVMESLENQREREEFQARLCSWNLTD
ncbi:hypothetical protein AYO20_06047 [Fonsecaea nubica]|uniref:Aminoglycoside phosphotransferase domain-containing protein n=1 Tax=Fonsecaea nubica TaxID=856822 RepID=A0A178CXK6_9EURO|nr:hypothetical protein AYO20_06047 [Fonsecaea nubica]OAL34630.1 hypothetical protein AYO20_06047 [Fonsecaea nubica]